MLYQGLADTVVLIHLSFVLFVLLGGVAVWRWRRLAWLHLPAALWGMAIELSGGICPLTHLENYLRRRGGGFGYDVSFVERYLAPLLYPLGLSRHSQLALALATLLLNLVIYARLLLRPPAPRK